MDPRLVFAACTGCEEPQSVAVVIVDMLRAEPALTTGTLGLLIDEFHPREGSHHVPLDTIAD